MSQNGENLRRQISRHNERLEQLEHLRMSDYQHHDEQLTHFAATERTLRKHSADRQRHELNALRRSGMLRDALLSMILVLLGIGLLTIRVGGQEVSKAEPPMPAASGQEAVETNENQYIEAALLSRSTRIDNCTITYYCTQPYAHICGTGDGITATGTQVSPGVSCAVDPDVIPLGSDVLVDYGDGELHYYKADDTGVTGSHIDLAVAGHDEALSLGVRTATVYWSAAEEG